MTNRGLAEVLLKLFGVYWLVNAVVTVPSLALGRATQGWTFVGLQALAIVLYAVLGLWLVAFGGRIARYLAPGDAGEIRLLAPARAQAIGFSLLGIYLACQGVAALATNLTSYFFLEGRETEWVTDAFIESHLPAIAENGVYVVAGVGLFFGSRALAGFWHRLRPFVKDAERD